MKYLCYLVGPGLAVTPSIGFTEIFVAFVQFGGDNQITFNTRAIYKLAPFLLTCYQRKDCGGDNDVRSLHALDLPGEILLTQIEGGKRYRTSS